jgi:hypothetical protein
LQEQKDKDALLKQQQELLRVAQEQKVSKCYVVFVVDRVAQGQYFSGLR